jgi:hypothetical protein
VEPLVSVCTKSERLIATSLSKIEFACQICQLIVLDVKAPRVSWQTGFQLPLQPSSSDINLLFARQTTPPAFKSSQAITGNTNHRFFSMDTKEEKFWPVPLRQETRSDKLDFEAAPIRSRNLESPVNWLVRQLGLSDWATPV